MAKGLPPGYILDAAGLFRISLIDSKALFTTNEVVNEVASENERLIVNSYIKSFRLKVLEPDKKASGLALNITGTSPRLTEADISVIALALQLGEQYDITVITDDYELQNVLALHNIKCKGIKTTGIKKIIQWTYRCTGCGRYFKKPFEICPYCGSAVKRKPRKIKDKTG
ncbi:MAG: hypothetical protein JRN26_04050 [Nitrososphaerota archaeon]|jgi:UPF0271 protein|nr:hypothetical protein [Nitrososphaerota archaeon]MDG6932428.1 hypothetical protein [Nitrososphaerota archaeon]MDG6936038.1 hypothetical protein [Nitrososphaerota archaeon]MDG6943682.1 hypothetical protein [Nitrososphaerota archaeon]